MGDDYLYFKFRAINKYMIESLVNPSLYFAKPNTLNDPFDCLIDLRNTFSRAVHLTTGNRRAWLKGIGLHTSQTRFEATKMEMSFDL